MDAMLSLDSEHRKLEKEEQTLRTTQIGLRASCWEHRRELLLDTGVDRPTFSSEQEIRLLALAENLKRKTEGKQAAPKQTTTTTAT